MTLGAAMIEKSACLHVYAVPTGCEGGPFLPAEPEPHSQMTVPLDVYQARTVSFQIAQMVRKSCRLRLVFHVFAGCVGQLMVSGDLAGG